MTKWHCGFSLLLVILLRDVTGTWARQCLPTAIEEPFRKNVTVDGVSRPIGLWVNGWDSAEVISELFAILVSESLGYNVVLNEGSNGRTQVYRLAGCDGVPEDGCDPPRKYDLGLESWFAATDYGSVTLKELGPTAPTIINILPYIGNSGMFIMGEPKQRAMMEDGLALEYYRFYDVNWFHPQKFTTKVHEIPLDRLKGCAASVQSLYPDIADIYLAATGDEDGVEEVNGTKVLKCYQGKWFASPACRAQPENCTALITGGDGWGTLHLTQQISFHSMPAAIATAVSGQWGPINKEFPSLTYWWKPDTTFVLQSPDLVLFPRHNQTEYARLVYGTQRKHTWLANLAAAGFEEAAPLAVALVRNLLVNEADMGKMLTQLVQNEDGELDHWAAACTWLRQETKWTSWLPSVTDCRSGSGLVDAAGNFVSDIQVAVGCQQCETGMFSAAVANTHTSVCRLCSPGSNQRLVGQATCTPCEPGTVTPVSGLSECELCGLGAYANESGMTACHSCGDQEQQPYLWTTKMQIGQNWVLHDGASSEEECSCVAGAFRTNGRCELCALGSVCSGNGNLTLHPGYFATVEEPNFIYKCFGIALACPGGVPGSCAEGRDPSSIACGSCLPGMRFKDSICTKCAAGDTLFAALVFLSTLCVLLCMYLIWVRRSSRTGYPGHVLITALALGQFVTAFQQLLVIQQFEIVWGEPFQSIMQFAEFISLNLDMVSLQCYAPGELSRYMLQTMLVPMITVVLAIIHGFYILSIRSTNAKLEMLVGALGSIFITFFITLCSAILAPFRCHVHPNGLWTVQDYPGALCNGEDTHFWMVLVGLATCCMPVAFFVVCCVVLIQLPKRLMQADVRFIRNTSFLLIRYRPGAERFAIFHLARNALVVLCPLVTSPSGRVLGMNGLILLSLIMTASVRPWRMEECNYLELLVLTGMLVILDAGSLYMQEVDSEVVTTICMVVLWILSLSAVLAGLLFGVGKHLKVNYKKRFQFFLCHHKKSSGALARLLKMTLAPLKETEGGGDVFIDCDDLTDLTRLFGYVAHETATFVILGSPHVLTRKWCIGEMATARVHGVETVLLAYPEYVKPSEQMIADYCDTVLDIAELSNYNIGFDDVRETLRWVNTVMTLELPPELTPDAIASFARRLSGASASRLSSYISSADKTADPDCYIVSDISNQEAVATAFVLFGYVSRKLLMDDSHLTLSVLLRGNHVSQKKAKCALLLCSFDCFSSILFAQWLLEVNAVPSCVALPVVADDFTPPGPTFWDFVKTDSSWRSIDVSTYTRVLQALFKDIPVAFAAQSYSALELEMRARQIVGRMGRGANALASKTVSRGISREFAKAMMEVRSEHEPDPSQSIEVDELYDSSASAPMMVGHVPNSHKEQQNWTTTWSEDDDEPMLEWDLDATVDLNVDPPHQDPVKSVPLPAKGRRRASRLELNSGGSLDNSAESARSYTSPSSASYALVKDSMAASFAEDWLYDRLGAEVHPKERTLQPDPTRDETWKVSEGSDFVTHFF